MIRPNPRRPISAAAAFLRSWHATEMALHNPHGTWWPSSRLQTRRPRCDWSMPTASKVPEKPPPTPLPAVEGTQPPPPSRWDGHRLAVACDLRYLYSHQSNRLTGHQIAPGPRTTRKCNRSFKVSRPANITDRPTKPDRGDRRGPHFHFCHVTAVTTVTELKS